MGQTTLQQIIDEINGELENLEEERVAANEAFDNARKAFNVLAKDKTALEADRIAREDAFWKEQDFIYA